MLDEKRLETARQELKVIIPALKKILEVCEQANRNLDILYLENTESVIIQDVNEKN